MIALHKKLAPLMWPFLLYGALLVFMFTTNPRDLPVGWLLAPFILLFMALFLTFKATLWRPGGKFGDRKARVMCGVAAAIPTLILLLDSVNQLTIRDSLILIAFGLIGLFYIAKLDFTR